MYQQETIINHQPSSTISNLNKKDQAINIKHHTSNNKHQSLSKTRNIKQQPSIETTARKTKYKYNEYTQRTNMNNE